VAIRVGLVELAAVTQKAGVKSLQMSLFPLAQAARLELLLVARSSLMRGVMAEIPHLARALWRLGQGDGLGECRARPDIVLALAQVPTGHRMLPVLARQPAA
jgi:hypothetical protein